MDWTPKLAVRRSPKHIPHPSSDIIQIVKALFLALSFYTSCVWAADFFPKPEAEGRKQNALNILSDNINRARKNLAASSHNIDILTGEIKALDRLQREHESLRAKYSTTEEKEPDPEKTKILLKGIEQGLGQIDAQRIPLQNKLTTWKERRKAYETKLCEFAKQREKVEVPPQLVSPQPTALD